MPDIFVVADFNIDLVLYLDRLPDPGETLNAHRFFEGPGGKGSNQAIAAARLGADVRMLAAIGDDYYGEVAARTWQENGINTDFLLRDADYQTAMALINVDRAGNNTITVHQGANLELTPAHVAAAESAIAQADIVMSTLGVPLPVVQRAFEIARAHSTRTLLNPAPAVKLPDNLIRLADIITPNETELATIAATDVSVSATLLETVRTMLHDDSQMMVVTRGADGAQYITPTESHLLPTFNVDVVDTVGAGDAFNAGFAVALAEGKSPDAAIRFANACAALSVTKIGAVAGLPHRQAVEDLLNSQS